MSDDARTGDGPDFPNPYSLIPTSSSPRLLRVPQIIGLLAAVGSVVILTLAVFAPGIFSDSGGQRPEVDIAGLQLTAEFEARESAPTSEQSLSDLAPTAASSATPTNEPTAAADGSTPEPAATATAAPVAAGEGLRVGVALEEFPGDFGAITEFGAMSGRNPDMIMFFQAWGNSDRDFKDWLPALSSIGVTPFITWEPWDRSDFIDQKVYTQDSILAGDHDPYIDNWAERAAQHGGPIYLRFAHEMNTPAGKTYWYPWQGDPEKYVAVWRYVHDRF